MPIVPDIRSQASQADFRTEYEKYDRYCDCIWVWLETGNTTKDFACSSSEGEEEAKILSTICDSAVYWVDRLYSRYYLLSRAYKRREGMQLLYEQSSNVGG